LAPRFWVKVVLNRPRGLSAKFLSWLLERQGKGLMALQGKLERLMAHARLLWINSHG